MKVDDQPVWFLQFKVRVLRLLAGGDLGFEGLAGIAERDILDDGGFFRGCSIHGQSRKQYKDSD